MMLKLLALLLLCYGVANVHCSTVHENSVDFHSLLDFKNGITNDPYGALGNWTTITHFCRWNGVNCSSTRPWRVIGLNLSNYNLAGRLPPSLGNLTFMKVLNLSHNNFFGSIPFLNKLEQLERLYLQNNLFQGTIPSMLTNSTNLQRLDLSTNMLVGSIPPNIGFSSNLTALGLTQNNLIGTIPPALGNITTLEGLYLSMNQLDGSIPVEIWELPNLKELFLGQNRLSGGIPQTLPNMSSLSRLGLEFNNLEKELPSNIGDALPRLQNLTLNSNMFVGRIPSSLGNASGLQYVDLSANNFSGQVPTFFGNLPYLFSLNLETNNLEASSDSLGWDFIYALKNCSNLYKLSVAENQLQGHIPDSIGNLSTGLNFLALGSNKLSAMVPTSITNLQGLIWLSLDNNNLNGTIENWVGKLPNLQGLYLQANDFAGSIPSSIGNLKNLSELSLNQNNFEGTIPPSLGNLSGLQHFDLSYNHLQGSIPLELTELKQLTSLHLSSNKLTGEIPTSLDNCKNLADIQMDQNFLIGNIPESLSNLIILSRLNLSRNNLSGAIPEKLSYLQLLIELDVSYNHLQGVVPRNGVFANATAVSLYGNSGLCGGAIDLHLPPCSTVSQRIDIRFYLIRVLIPIFGFMSLVLLVYLLLVVKKRSRTKYLALTPFGEHFHKVSYNDLAKATRNFSESNIIGRGSYGTVYKGKLKDHNMEVAVKVFNLEMQGAERSFLSECEALRSIQHRNLLSILTACSTVDSTGNVFKALVYEFMSNGNLDTWLHHKEDDKAPNHLGLTQRIAVAVNIADALDYLHYDCGRPTVHCDLKPSNILLDEDMNALLGDFGIARFYPGSRALLTASIGVKGTIGYIAPEYGQGGQASTSGDAYSFGIILLELMTGKRPTDPMFNDGLDIIKFVQSKLPRQISEAIDARLLEECRDFDQANIEPESAVYESLVSLVQVALSSTHPSPSERINMKQAASKMHAIQELYLQACKAK